jgi:hypothetical protein
MIMDDFENIKSQSKFCKELMTRLDDDIQKSGHGTYSGMSNYTQKQNDIVRIRRELNALAKLLDPWRKDE